MKEYKGKSKSILGLGIAIVVLMGIIAAMLAYFGVRGLTIVFTVLIALIVNLLYKGMILKILVDQDKVAIYKPLGKKTIRFENVAFCMVHGIDETESIMYAFVKKGKGVRGVKQNLSYQEIVKRINQSDENLDLDINFSMAEKIPVSFVENSEELKTKILDAIGGHQKNILNKI